LTKNLRDK